jgi:predicted RNA binding protein YcfA (HicA-like mRNA interferase family)
LSSKDKLVKKLKSKPKNLTWDELIRLLGYLGFEEKAQGKTTGSGRKFFNARLNIIINVHKPHPDKIIKPYIIKQIVIKLKEEHLI